VESLGWVQIDARSREQTIVSEVSDPRGRLKRSMTERMISTFSIDIAYLLCSVSRSATARASSVSGRPFRRASTPR
jgi:hypothetical protein